MLTLSRLRDGTTVLSGKVADLPSCPTCTNVGFIEHIVLDDEHLYQNQSRFGPSHDRYELSFPPYRFRWEGPVEAAAR